MRYSIRCLKDSCKVYYLKLFKKSFYWCVLYIKNSAQTSVCRALPTSTHRCAATPSRAPATGSGEAATPLGPATPTHNTAFETDVSGLTNVEAFVFFSFHPTLCVWCLLCPCVAGGLHFLLRSPPLCPSTWESVNVWAVPRLLQMRCSIHPWPCLVEQVSFHRWGQSPEWLDHLSPPSVTS